MLDRVTLRSLEIVQNLRDGERAGTLLEAVDRTVTAPGARRLRCSVDQRHEHAFAIHRDEALAPRAP